MPTTDNPQQSRWVIRSNIPKKQVMSYAKSIDIHPMVARILLNRGFTSQDDTLRFIKPSLKNIYDPFLMHGMREAVIIILKVLERGDKIVIHGDYDVDGVSSVSLLYSFLRGLGANVTYFIPNREQDGYGLSKNSVQRFHDDNVSLLITTDCGISNYEEVTFAKSLGLKVIIVDHHKIPPEIPPADAVINPLLTQCTYPFKPFAAVGVTFLLAAALRAELRKLGVFNAIPEPDLRDYLDLVALGTVADVMPMYDQNRILVHHGLLVLASRRRPGISALMEKLNIPIGPITANDISFKLAPRINAAGRVADASVCVELLTTNSYAEAVNLTCKIECLNIQRKSEERETLDSAMIRAHRQVEDGHKALVLYDQKWHHGVLGIVASRLVDTYHLPTILLRLGEDGIARGSARATEGIDLVELFSTADQYLTTYGGHKLAAGLAIKEESIPDFQRVLDLELTRRAERDGESSHVIDIDGEISISELTLDFMVDLLKLAPFGCHNPEPILLMRSIHASGAAVVGRDHLRFKIMHDGQMHPAFGFSLSQYENLVNKTRINIAFSPRLVHKRGITRIELFIHDLKPADADI